MNTEAFLKGLERLAKKTGVIVTSRMTLRDMDDYVAGTPLYVSANAVDVGNGVMDRCGPFALCMAEKKAAPVEQFTRGKAPYVSSDYDAYDCPVTGKMVEGRAAHRENLKRTGCRILEKGEKEHAAKRREETFNDACSKLAESIVFEAARMDV